MAKNRTPFHPIAPHGRGLALRDYFAAQALPSAIDMLMRDAVIKDTQGAIDQTAILSYRIADAMMAEREREN